MEAPFGCAGGANGLPPKGEVPGAGLGWANGLDFAAKGFGAGTSVDGAGGFCAENGLKGFDGASFPWKPFVAVKFEVSLCSSR